MPARILIVDDEENMRRSLRLLLSDLDVEVVEAPDGESALATLAAGGVDLVVSDLRMPGIDGRELLRRSRALRPDVPVILITAYGTIESAVDAIREGAFDYVPKPFRENELKLVIERALAMSTVLRENRQLRAELERRHDFSRIIGTSPAIVECLRLAGEVAETDTTVLLLGESGTGKEVFARAIHWNSARRGGPFVAVNCAALPESLLESELFGHERGAFTGADRRRDGRFRAADGGTLFLDEIGDMSPKVQAKLLRVLEDRTYERLGGDRRLKADVRIVCATHRDLKAMVEAGELREDLWYRISAYPIRLPPLRDRREDVLPIARAALEELGRQMGKRLEGFDDDARRRLETHAWPGNVRELRNAIERAAILAKGPRIGVGDLMLDALAAPADDGAFLLPATGLDLAELERSLIDQALERTDGNVSAAARLLGLTRAQLRYRLSKPRRDA